MFELTNEKKAQGVAISDHLEKIKFSPVLPEVFTEHGIMMVANVLSSERTIKASIQIIEVFIKMRKALTGNLNLRLEIQEIKKKLSNLGKNIIGSKCDFILDEWDYLEGIHGDVLIVQTNRKIKKANRL